MTQVDRVLTPEQRHELAMAPLPTVRVIGNERNGATRGQHGYAGEDVDDIVAKLAYLLRGSKTT